MIVGIPDPLLKKLIKGPNASLGIAKTLAGILNVPYVNALSTMSYVSSGEFQLKRSISIENKKVLLIGESRSQHFFAAGEALIEGSPSLIMGGGIFT